MAGRARFKLWVDARDASGFGAGARSVRGILQRNIRGDLLLRLVRVSRQAAPERTGALARGLRSYFSGAVGGEVVSTVRSPRGYAYTGVTRFGHRTPWIVPKRKKALAFEIDGRRIVRNRVRGYRPTHDWADDAYRLAEPHVAHVARQIGRELEAVIG